jgi:type II secretory pathway component HofQ
MQLSEPEAFIMSRLPRLLSILFAVLCLAAATLSAQEAGSGRHPRAIAIGSSGVVSLGQGPAGQGPWRGARISLSLRGAPLPEVLRSFAQLGGLNLILDPKVPSEPVTVELKDVPWDLALYVILKTHHLGAEVDGQLWLVAPPG